MRPRASSGQSAPFGPAAMALAWSPGVVRVVAPFGKTPLAVGPNATIVNPALAGKIGYFIAEYSESGSFLGARPVLAVTPTRCYAWPRRHSFVHNDDGTSTLLVRWFQGNSSGTGPRR